MSSIILLMLEGGGPRVVVSTAAFHARVRGSVPGLGGLKETKLYPRVKGIVGIGSVLGLRPPGLEFRILCLEGSSQSSHHPQEVLLALAYMCGLKLIS